MQQLTLPMLTVYDGLRLLDEAQLLEIKTYREAVRLCWKERTRRNLTQRMLAELAGLYPSHVSDYLSEREDCRELPAKHIDGVERVLGNRAITQWHLLQTQRPESEIDTVRRAA